MKHRISLSLALVLCAGLLAGCSSEVHDPHQTCWCPTDGLASLGQEIYFGKFTPCWSDGHAVPVTLPERCVYYGDSLAGSTSGNTGSVYTGVTVSGSGNMQHP